MANHVVTDTDEGFGAYLIKRLIGEKRYQMGVPQEALELERCSDAVLSYLDFGLLLTCVLERKSPEQSGFSISQRELLEIGRACLPHTGKVNGQRMPVGIQLYELGKGPPSDEDRARLKALNKSGLGKVHITTFYLDTIHKTVWSSAAFNGRLRGRVWLEKVLREPRRHDHEILVPNAVVLRAGPPIVTFSTLALLVAVFVVEQLAKGTAEQHGLLGVDVGTLFAMGGANSSAILGDGQWYRLLTASLLHADALHLLLNGVALGLAGYLLEALIGPAWLVVVFFLGALGGSLMGLAVNSAEVVSVGASGAVMALLAAALVASLRLPRGQERTSVQLPLLQFLLPSLLPLATHRQEGHVDFAAHFGGAITGALLGYALLKIWPRDQERPRFPAVATGGALLAAVSFVLSGVLAKSGYADAADVASAGADAALLIEDAKIPLDVGEATRDVEVWGKDYPRDPRVHYYRALRHIEEPNVEEAMSELRAALGEQKILDRAFSNKQLEIALRTTLCELLVDRKNTSEAKIVAAPVCTSPGQGPPRLIELGVCD